MEFIAAIFEDDWIPFEFVLKSDELVFEASLALSLFICIGKLLLYLKRLDFIVLEIHDSLQSSIIKFSNSSYLWGFKQVFKNL